jgi:SRSO17 transposase
MDSRELKRLAEDLGAFHHRFHPYFQRPEPREQSLKYLEGLISSPERRNGWHIAQAVGDPIPDKTQRLLYRSHLDQEGLEKEHRKFCREEFGTRDGIFLVDETGFLKKGTKSAGVQRQYSGTFGKVENCQVGTFLGYASGDHHVLLDRRLYLPEVWCSDWNRRKDAKIPKGIRFRTKPELALAMLQNAVLEGMPGKWVAGDEVYGNSPTFRAGAAQVSLKYVLAVARTLTVWKGGGDKHRGRPSLSFWPSEDKGKLEWVARNLPARCWKKLTLRPGEKGPITYWWAAVRIRLEPAGPEFWFLIRRSVSDRDDMAFYLSNAGPQTTLKTLARVASMRFAVEQCFEEAKGEAGLDEYEVRRWDAWHRHTLFALMAHAFLMRRKKRSATSSLNGNHPTFPPTCTSYPLDGSSFCHALDKVCHQKTCSCHKESV